MADYERFRVTLSNLRHEADRLVGVINAKKQTVETDEAVKKLLEEFDDLLVEMVDQDVNASGTPEMTDNYQTLISRKEDFTLYYEKRLGSSKLH